jgi:hypothetical protein
MADATNYNPSFERTSIHNVRRATTPQPREMESLVSKELGPLKI